MKKLTLILVSLLLLVACDNTPPDPAKKTEYKKPYAERQSYFVHYYKDQRTDVCFAGNNPTHLDHDHSHLSVVPCTPHIEELVETWPDPEN
jgi:hypothetical protein